MATINVSTVANPGSTQYEVPQTCLEDQKTLIWFCPANFNNGAGALASDVLDVTLPAEWVNQVNYGFTVKSVVIEQWPSTQTVGNRVKTQIPTAGVSWREDTGVVAITLGNQPFAGTGQAGNIIITVTMAGAVGVG